MYGNVQCFLLYTASDCHRLLADFIYGENVMNKRNNKKRRSNLSTREIYRYMYSSENVITRDLEREVRVKNGSIKGIRIG